MQPMTNAAQRTQDAYFEYPQIMLLQWLLRKGIFRCMILHDLYLHTLTQHWPDLPGVGGVGSLVRDWVHRQFTDRKFQSYMANSLHEGPALNQVV